MIVSLEIDVYYDGVLQGSGPIHQVTALSVNDRTNEAAGWSFTAQLKTGTPTTLLLLEDVECFGYLVGIDGRTPLFGGRILQADPEPGESGVMISVSGSGLLSELAYDHLVSLEVSHSVTRAPRGARTLTGAGEIDVPEWFDGDSNTSAAATLTSIDWIYVYDTSRFYEIIFDVSVANGGSSQIDFETYSARKSSSGRKGWSTITPIIEEWSGGGVPLSTTGQRRLTFTTNDSWDEVILDGKQGYYFRFRPTTGTISFSLRGIIVTIKGPNTTDDFQSIVDSSIRFGMQSGSRIASTNGYYGVLSDISILAAMRRATEGSNDIFRIGAADVREIELISADAPNATGMRATGPFQNLVLEDLPYHMLVITKAKKAQDFRKKINKLFVYGNGSGHGSHYTLADHTLEAGGDFPAGYSINRDESSVTYDAGFALSPLVSSVRYRDIQTLDGYIQGPEVSNQLARLALAELALRINGVRHYSIDAVGFRANLLRPGDSFLVEYAEYDQGTAILRIDEELIVTSVSYRLNNGILEASLTASSVARAPMDERDYLLGELETAKRTDTNEQRLSGSALFGPRVPVEGDGGSSYDRAPDLIDINRFPLSGLVCVPAGVFLDEYNPTTTEFEGWLTNNDAGAGTRYGYAPPGTGDAADPDWIWVSNGDGTATVERSRDI